MDVVDSDRAENKCSVCSRVVKGDLRCHAVTSIVLYVLSREEHKSCLDQRTPFFCLS